MSAHDPGVRHGGGGPQTAGEPHRLEHLNRFVEQIPKRLPPDDVLLIIGPGTVGERLERHILENDGHHGRHRDTCVRGVPTAHRSPADRMAPPLRGRRPPTPHGRGILIERAPALPPIGPGPTTATTRHREAAAPAWPNRALTKKEKDMEGKTIRLLVAIDGSEPAGVAVDLVADFAWPDGTEILVAEVVESGAGLFGEPWSALAMVQADSIEAEIRADADRTVDEARGRLVRPGLNVEAVVLRGRPATAIVDRARGMGADLIIVGSRGHGTIESMLLGSSPPR